MKTMIVTLPEKEESFFLELLKKFHFKSRVISGEEIALDKWDELTDVQRAELNEAMAQIDSGKGIPHEKVMSKLRNR